MIFNSLSSELQTQVIKNPLHPEAKAEGVSAGTAFGLARLGREDQVQCTSFQGLRVELLFARTPTSS